MSKQLFVKTQSSDGVWFHCGNALNAHTNLGNLLADDIINLLEDDISLEQFKAHLDFMVKEMTAEEVEKLEEA